MDKVERNFQLHVFGLLPLGKSPGGKGMGINMKNFSDNKYIKKNITREWLSANGFRYNRLFSNEETDVYTYRFPVYKYERFTILECELKVILGEDIVSVNVYDHNTINKYVPFYHIGFGDYSVMLKKIGQRIDQEVKKLGITR